MEVARGALACSLHDRREIRSARRIERRGEADVAIVVGDDSIASFHQFLTEFAWPACELHAGPGDEKDSLAVRGAEALVRYGDAVSFDFPGVGMKRVEADDEAGC